MGAFVFSPGGRSREAMDGGYIFPFHLDAAFITEFYPLWRSDGISFAVVPLTGQPAPDDAAPKGKTPANKLHANLFPSPDFRAYLASMVGFPVENASDAHTAVRGYFELATLSDLTEAQLAKLTKGFLAWKKGK